MSELKLKLRTDSQGALHVQVGVPDAEVEMTVKVPDPNGHGREAECRGDWEAFVRRTAGSIKDSAFKRHPQGEYPVRELIS